MKKPSTYQQLRDIVAQFNTIDQDVQDKLSIYAYDFSKELEKHSQRYLKKVRKIRLDRASLDPNKNIAYIGTGQDRNYAFTREKLLEIEDAIEKLDEQVIEIKTYICPDNSRAEKLPFATKIVLNGFLFELPDPRAGVPEPEAVKEEKEAETPPPAETGYEAYKEPDEHSK